MADLAKQLRSHFNSMSPEVAEAVESALKSKKLIDITVTCPGCKKVFRKRTQTDDFASRLKAVQLVLDTNVARLASQRPDEDVDRITFKRTVIFQGVEGGPQEA